MDNLSLSRWVWALIGGLVFGSLIQAAMQDVFPILYPENPVMPLFPLDLSLGLTIGTLQAIVLRHNLTRAWLWVVATAVGVAVSEIIAGFMVHDILNIQFGFYRSSLRDALLAHVSVGFTLGLCVGLPQLFVLYLEGYRATLWIPVTTVGLTTVIILTDYLAVPEALFVTVLGPLVGIIIGGMIYGILTSFVLKRLSRSNH